MAILSFTLNPEGIKKIHDALVCLGKFSEAVCIEATIHHVSCLLLHVSILLKQPIIETTLEN